MKIAAIVIALLGIVVGPQLGATVVTALVVGALVGSALTVVFHAQEMKHG